MHRRRSEGLTVLGKVFNKGPALAALTGFFFLLCSVFACLGMQLFGGHVTGLANGNAPVLQACTAPLFRVHAFWPLGEAGCQRAACVCSLLPLPAAEPSELLPC